MKILFFLLISVSAFAQLQPLNVPGDTQREINTKSKNNFNYLEGRTDSIVSNLTEGAVYNGDPTIILQNSTHRFVSDTQITTWNNKADVDHDHAGTYAPLLHVHDLTGDHGDISASGSNGTTWNIDAQAIDFSKIQNANGPSVLGRSATSTGVLDEIVSSAPGQVLIRSTVDGAIRWATLIEANYANLSVTNAKINDVAWTKITGVPDFSLSTHDHSGIYQPVGDYSLTTHNHDLVYQPIGSYSLTGHSHVYADLPDLAGRSVLGRSQTNTGPLQTLTATVDGQVLVRNGTLGFALLSDASISNVSWTKIINEPTTLTGYGITDGQETLVSGTNIKTINGTSVLGSGDIAIAGSGNSEIVLRLASDVSTPAAVTLVDLTGMSFAYEANSTYRINFYMITSAAAATTGHGFGIDCSTAPTTVALNGTTQLANTGTVTGWQCIADNNIVGVTSGTPSAGANVASTGQGVLVTNTAGTAVFRFRSEVAAVATCRANSVITILKIN